MKSKSLPNYQTTPHSIKESPSYTWLLFDADNTLWDFSAAEASALERVLVERDIEWSTEVLGTYRLINRAAWDDYEQGILPKSQLRDIRFQRLLEHYRQDHPAEEVSFSYRQYLAASNHMLNGAMDVLDAVRGRYRLGLITNGLHEVQRPRLVNTGIEDYFEFVVISDEIGVAKPDAAFFDHAFAFMEGIDPAEVLIIGDNPNADIKGGLNYGCDACWLRHPGAADRKALGETYRIRAISELLEFV